MKKMQMPSMEVVTFDAKDVIATSGNSGAQTFTPLACFKFTGTNTVYDDNDVACYPGELFYLPDTQNPNGTLLQDRKLQQGYFGGFFGDSSTTNLSSYRDVTADVWFTVDTDGYLHDHVHGVAHSN